MASVAVLVCWGLGAGGGAGNGWLGFGVADNLGPGSERAGTTPGSSAGHNCLELWKWIWWCVADWLQAGRGTEPFPEHWKLLSVTGVSRSYPGSCCVLLIKERFDAVGGE